MMSGCTSTPHKKIEQIPISRSILINPDKAPALPKQQNWLQQPPADYLVWLNQSDNKQRVQRYENYLKQNRISHIAPTYQLLRSARDWAKCDSSPYAIPSSELWDNALPTLKVLQYLVDTNVLRDFEITSAYRDYSLNICAGGAKNSRHVYNSAIDFRIGPADNLDLSDLILIEDTKKKLCDFWYQYGQTLNIGLGVYASGQIHIDTMGYRTWGPDHTYNTSICS